MNCHLADGKDNAEKRFNEIKDIYNTNVSETKGKTPNNYDIQFLFGDLNFHIDFSDELTTTYTKNREFSKLLKNEQLWNQYHIFNYLPHLVEAPIEFPPTYRFLKDGSYDTEKSPPAWCDRILFVDKESIKYVSYKMIDAILLSNHKPVCGNYLVTINHTEPISELSKSAEDSKSDMDIKKSSDGKTIRPSSSTELSHGNINASYVVVEHDKQKQINIFLTLTVHAASLH